MEYKSKLSLIIKPDLDGFKSIIEKEIEEKNIIRYDGWIKI